MIKVLQIHNKYLQYGGEDAVVDNEYKLLKENDIFVDQIIFENTNINPLKLFNNKESYNTVRKKILEFKPNVMHVHNIFYQASTSVLKAAKEEGVPVIMTLHNFRLLCPGGLFLRNSKTCMKCKDIMFPYHGFIYKCFQDSYTKSLALSLFLGLNKNSNTWNKLVDRFIVLTPFIKDLILDSSLKLNDDKVIVKPNSTDDFNDNEYLTKEREGFLFVGRLAKEKGIDTLIDAFNQMPDQNLNIIGTGEMETELKEVANQNITFFGKQNRLFVKEKLLRTKALVFPSIWYEGLPNTIIEAFSSSTPVLSSNINNLNQIITAGYNGELFEPNDSMAIVNKVKDFLNTDTSFFYENSRATYLQKYTHNINLENLKALYSNYI